MIVGAFVSKYDIDKELHEHVITSSQKHKDGQKLDLITYNPSCYPLLIVQIIGKHELLLIMIEISNLYMDAFFFHDYVHFCVCMMRVHVALRLHQDNHKEGQHFVCETQVCFLF